MTWINVAIATLAPLAMLAGSYTACADADGGGSRMPTPCTSAAYRQFDFFVGDWDAFEIGAPAEIIARNQVSSILGGCTVLEDYRQSDGVHGESFSIYDASRESWHQTWVTSRGTLLLLDGGVRNGDMVLTGTEQATHGTSSLLRGVWHRDGASVRETAQRSRDGGKTWKPVFDIEFRPHHRQSGPRQDDPNVAVAKAQIAELEQRWIDAAVTGDRRALKTILADDFIDVSAKGEIRGKSDVIGHPATSRNVTQSIKDLTVRVWGDTAVATGVNRVHSTDKGWTVEVPFSDTFARIGGQWRAVSAQETLRHSDAAH
ncbi:MAG: nuclear transport factor 2 family protein [Rhodanobacteraceae bacterium]